MEDILIKEMINALKITIKHQAISWIVIILCYAIGIYSYPLLAIGVVPMVVFIYDFLNYSNKLVKDKEHNQLFYNVFCSIFWIFLTITIIIIIVILHNSIGLLDANCKGNNCLSEGMEFIIYGLMLFIEMAVVMIAKTIKKVIKKTKKESKSKK